MLTVLKLSGEHVCKPDPDLKEELQGIITLAHEMTLTLEIFDLVVSWREQPFSCTAVSCEAWAKLRDWASVAGRGRLILSGSVAHASLKTTVFPSYLDKNNDITC